MDIKFSFEGLPPELEGKTFQDVFTAVRLKNNELRKRIIEKTGSSVYTPEVDDMLTPEEMWYLQAGQMFHNLAQ